MESPSWNVEQMERPCWRFVGWEQTDEVARCEPIFDDCSKTRRGGRVPLPEAGKLFADVGGIVVGERYRVDKDNVATQPFSGLVRESWGQGGPAPLLSLGASFGSSHGRWPSPACRRMTDRGTSASMLARACAACGDRRIGPCAIFITRPRPAMR